MIVSITSIELKGLFKFFALSHKAMYIRKQLRKSDCVSLKTKGLGKKHYTISMWNNEKDMKEFAHSGAHLEAMKTAQTIAKQIRVITYEVNELPDWENAQILLKNDSRTKIFNF